MAEPLSPLPQGARIDGAGVTLLESPGRDLVQLAGWPRSFAAVAARAAALIGCPVPGDTRTATASDSATLFMVGPERLWIVTDAAAATGLRLREAFAPAEAAVTELGHGRTVIRVSGDAAAELLARGVAVDLDSESFAVGRFAQTRLHHSSVLLHRAGETSFDLYVPRSYALALWDWFGRTVGLFRP